MISPNNNLDEFKRPQMKRSVSLYSLNDLTTLMIDDIEDQENKENQEKQQNLFGKALYPELSIYLKKTKFSPATYTMLYSHFKHNAPLILARYT